MHGRDFVRHVKALERAGLYVSHGSYLLDDSFTAKPNGMVRMTD
jgi:hypothetical protein